MPIVYTAYYMSLFALSLGVLGICFEIRGKEILFGESADMLFSI